MLPYVGALGVWFAFSGQVDVHDYDLLQAEEEEEEEEECQVPFFVYADDHGVYQEQTKGANSEQLYMMVDHGVFWASE